MLNIQVTKLNIYKSQNIMEKMAMSIDYGEVILCVISETTYESSHNRAPKAAVMIYFRSIVATANN